MTYPRRLIEVDLPIKRISAHARREKSIRHGHISTLHIWWARRPLAACRAVICAALWPDPADENCPPAFRAAAATVLGDFAEAVRSDPKLAELCRESWTRWNRTTPAVLHADDPRCWADLRYGLLDFIADFANWDASTVPAFLETARTLTRAAHEALGGDPGTRPLVVDPFAGGGSIPLEALRVGADAFASDLNPVAVLLNKVVLEYIPKYGQRLANEVRTWGAWIKEQAERELAEFYPKDPDGATPIAYLWARTIRCEGPGCGAEVPLIRSLWLGKKENRSVALRLVPDRERKRVEFEIVPNARARDVGEGTVRRGSATCPCCGFTTPVASVRKQLAARRGGASDARLFCVVTTRPDEQGRFYRLPTERDLDAVRRATEELERRQAAHVGPLSLVPDEPLPPQGTLGFRVQLYGMQYWADLFAPRQVLALTTLVERVRDAQSWVDKGEDKEFAGAVADCLSLVSDKVADGNSAQVWWMASGEKTVGTFTRQAISFIFDFGEIPLTNAPSRGIGEAVEWIAQVIDHVSALGTSPQGGQSFRGDAAHSVLPANACEVVFTDPPYYDAVPYADLSDFFCVWLKRSGARLDLVGSLTPKDAECIVDPQNGKDSQHFETRIRAALAEARRITKPNGIATVVFAHKSTSGWESLLVGLIESGWTVTATWPIDTERQVKVNTIDRAFLASSIHLVCRPRQDLDEAPLPDGLGDWRDILTELPKRVHAWLPRLVSEGVVGADAIFACLGPALEIFSRYERVEKASGELVKLGEYLEHVWAAVAREALSLLFEGADASGLEPDARLTAMWLWTLSSAKTNGNAGQDADPAEEGDPGEENGSGKKAANGRYALEFDAARKIAQGLGAHLDKLGHVVAVTGETARLLTAAERTGYLFGKAETAVATKQSKRSLQPALPGLAAQLAEAEEETSLGVSGPPSPGVTALDRVHQAMILFGAGRAEALKRFLVDDGVGSNRGFWTLAQSLSALYPVGSDEKRWVDGVLARKKGFGF